MPRHIFRAGVLAVSVLLTGACALDPAEPSPSVVATPVLGDAAMIADDGTPLPLHRWPA